jgi:hypothetical protein
MSSEKDHKMKKSFFSGAADISSQGTAKDGSNNKQTGVKRAEAFAKLIRGKGGRKIFWIIAAAVYACNWVVSSLLLCLLDSSPFPASSSREGRSWAFSLSDISMVLKLISLAFLSRPTAFYGRKHNLGILHLGYQ